MKKSFKYQLILCLAFILFAINILFLLSKDYIILSFINAGIFLYIGLTLIEDLQLEEESDLKKDKLFTEVGKNETK